MSNMRKAQEEINYQYPNIQNIRCITYYINLIACNIIAYKFANKLLHCINILVTFFCNNSRIGSKIQEMIKASDISDGGLKLYSYEKEEEDVDELSRTLSSDIIKNIIVIIEFLTIEQIINLNNHLIINSLGRIPEEDIDILDDDQTSTVTNNSNNETIVGREVLNFSNDDLLEEFEFWLCHKSFGYAKRVLAMPKNFDYAKKILTMPKEFWLCQKSFGYAKRVLAMPKEF
ncbi:12899_t:CDS:2 [Ambispora leptoticha]|uniref:12899_t:CDS:1 n=1 Tax=Ambispora leptoticha TaxID=144679 RepID=A0A9N8ZRD3_9GLOM|nr:12899_t:CDS:2 [Ambispora leptoticha]